MDLYIQGGLIPILLMRNLGHRLSNMHRIVQFITSGTNFGGQISLVQNYVSVLHSQEYIHLPTVLFRSHHLPILNAMPELNKRF